MARFLAITAATIALQCSATGAEYISPERLEYVCSLPEGVGFCQGYVAGLSDTAQAIAPGAVCLPAGITIDELLHVVLSGLPRTEGVTARGSSAAVHGVLTIMGTWPCPK